MQQPRGLSAGSSARKKSLAKGHKLRESIYIAFWTWQIYGGGEQIDQWLPEVRTKGERGVATAMSVLVMELVYVSTGVAVT